MQVLDVTYGEEAGVKSATIEIDCLNGYGYLSGADTPSLSIFVEQLLHRKVQRFRGGLVFKAHTLLYHSTLGLRVIKKKKKTPSLNERRLTDCFLAERNLSP